MKTFKNGLTEDQVKRAKELLARVNKSDLCRTLKIERATLENVLRGESPQVETLKKVLIEANKVLARRRKTAESLPI